MKLIIDIPDDVYKKIIADKYAIYDRMYYSIKNGTVLPEQHGRLIDADKLKEQDFGDNYYTIKAEIDRANTIVKADKSESEDKE